MRSVSLGILMVLILRVEVVPNMLVQSEAFEASILGTTSTLRITHQNSLETEARHAPYFGGLYSQF